MKRRLVFDDEEDEERQCPELPLDVWGEIFGYLHYLYVTRCASVCKVWHEQDLLLKSVKSLRPSELLYINDEKLTRMPNLASLELIGWHMESPITNRGLEKLVNLKHLSLQAVPSVTNDALKRLSGLTSLDLKYRLHVGDEGIKGLHLLKSLRVCCSNYDLSDACLYNLTNLTALCIHGDSNITDASVSRLVSLKHLDLSNNTKITHDALTPMTALERLNISGRFNKVDGTLFTASGSTMSNTLTHLCLSRSNYRVNDEHITVLTRLRELGIEVNDCITGAALTKMSSLTSLAMGRFTRKVTQQSLACLPNLTQLLLADHLALSEGCIAALTSLKKLYVPCAMLPMFRGIVREEVDVLDHTTHNDNDR